MEEYGYINNDGYLVSKFLEPLEIKYEDENGNIKTKLLSIPERLKEMGDMWKPVDRIDDKMVESDDPYYTIQIIPYDAGDRISYRYEKVPDNAMIKKKINELKETLNKEDYKIIKCYELSLSGETLPYDIVSLHNKRQEIRNKINELETKIQILNNK